MMPLDLDVVKQSLKREQTLCDRQKSLRRFLLALLFLICAEVILSIFALGGALVAGDSMHPAMKNGDFIFYNRLKTAPSHGEIVVIYNHPSGQYYVKRAIASEGDVVELTNTGVVILNGVPLEEPYANAPTLRQDLVFPQTVPPGHFFVLGDNRPVSKDSRNSEVGMVAQKDVKGTLLFSLRRR